MNNPKKTGGRKPVEPLSQKEKNSPISYAMLAFVQNDSIALKLLQISNFTEDILQSDLFFYNIEYLYGSYYHCQEKPLRYKHHFPNLI